LKNLALSFIADFLCWDLASCLRKGAAVFLCGYRWCASKSQGNRNAAACLLHSRKNKSVASHTGVSQSCAV